jgi:hypothetical protein
MSVDVDTDLSAEMEAKMKHKFANIEKRNEVRAENISKAREAEAGKGEERTTDVVADFHKNLQDQVQSLQNELDKAAHLDQSLVPAYLDETHRKLLNLGKYVTDSVMFLPSYDVQKSQDAVKEMTGKFHEAQALLQPKKKFGFKGARQKKGLAPQPPVKPTPDVADSATKPNLDTGVSLRNKKDLKFELEEKETNAADVTLADLENCKVVVHGSPSTLHMSNIKNCRIFGGPVSSSIFIENCSNSTLCLSSQQLRIHNTVETDFYIHVTAKAIIEDCSKLRFGPHPGLDWIPESTWKVSTLHKTVNHWSKVGDFNWLAADKPSPNWTKMEAQPEWASLEQFLQSP